MFRIPKQKIETTLTLGDGWCSLAKQHEKKPEDIGMDDQCLELSSFERFVFNLNVWKQLVFDLNGWYRV